MGHRGINRTGKKSGVTFYFEEGDFTRNEDMDTDFGPSKGGAFDSRMYEGTEVQICSSADWTVEKLASGIAIGRVNSPVIEGDLPRADANSGTYQKRFGRVAIDGDIDRVKLIATNQEITPGMALGVSGAGKTEYDKEEDTTTNVYALEAASAASGKYIDVFRKGVSQNVAD